MFMAKDRNKLRQAMSRAGLEEVRFSFDFEGAKVVIADLNKAAGGVPVRIETHLHMPPGRIVAISDMIDYPGANIDAPISVRTLDDYYAFEYAANYAPGVQGGGPRNDLAVRTFETLVVRAPVTCGVIQDLASTEA